MEKGEIQNQTVSNEITKTDVRKGWFRWYFANAISHSFDRYLASALLWALMPMLRKLYPDKKELQKAYQRHSIFYNTQISWGGGTILGIIASLEDKRSKQLKNGEETEEIDDLINNTKAGLMGALAGIGDSIDSGTVQYIFIAIALPWAQKGMAIGAIAPFIAFASYQILMGLYFSLLGFKLGRQAATEIVSGRRMKGLVEALSILGLFMMGVLGANYVKVSSTLKWTISGKKFVLQDILDTVLPGLLPLVAIGAVYFYFIKKDMKITRALVALTIILGILGALGIL